MSVIQVYFDFGSGWYEVSDLVRDGLSVSHRASSDNFHYAQNVASFTINYDEDIYNNIILATDPILVKITKDTVDFFQGFIPPTIKRTYTGILDLTQLDLEAVDSTETLKVPMGDVVYTGCKILDSADTGNSLIHKLASIAGITALGIDNSVTISTVCSGLAPSSPDEDVLSIMDKLLYEYGYVLNFNESDQISPIAWKTSASGIHTFNEDNILGKIVKDQNERNKFDGVKVIWYELGLKTDTLVYQEDLPYDNFGAFEGYPIPAGYDYPPEANVDDPVLGGKQEVRQEYDDTGILYRTNKAIVQGLDFNYSAFKSDFTDIVQTTNHTLDDIYDVGITIPTAEFGNKSARVIYRNPTAGSLKLYAFNIRADVLYKTSERYAMIQNVVNTTNYFVYQSSFIFTQTDADNLTQAIAKDLEVGKDSYSFSSEDEVAVGSIATIVTGDDTNQEVFLIERSYDSHKEIYSYKAKAHDTNFSTIIRPVIVYQPKAFDPITEQQVLARPTFDQMFTSGFNAGGGVTVPTVPVVSAFGLFKGIQLQWDEQENLSNFKNYHVQVSISGIDWYPLRFDRVDWKQGSIDEYTEWPTAFLVHTTPLIGTEDSPEGLTLQYRVSRVTRANVVSAWSTVASGVASPVDTGDVAENSITANKVKAGAIESKHLLIGDTTVPQGEAIPDGAELFSFDSLSCASHLGRRPQTKAVKLEQGDIGVDNPWFYERRWTVPIGLVAAYTINAGAGSVLRDDSGNFKDGTISGATWTNDATKGWCLSFDGTDDCVNLGTSPITTQSFTISLWVKCGASQLQYADIMDASHSLPGNWGIQQDNNNLNTFAFFYYDSTSSSYIFTNTFILPQTWAHLVCTRDGGTSTVKAYVDTVEVGTGTGTGDMLIVTPNLIVGGFNEGGRYFKGQMDEIRFYNRKLTSTEISALYTETSPYEDVYEPPCDNAVWLGKTTTNLVRSTDLDNAVWTKLADYHTNYGNVFDADLQKTVWKWNKGSSATATFVLDPFCDPGGTGTYIFGLMIKCNYSVVVRTYFYPLGGEAAYTLLQADTWTLINNRIVAGTNPTGIGFFCGMVDGGNFPADIEFRACDPYVALESYPMPFVPTTRPASSLWYNFEWPQAGTVGFWVKPGFGYNRSPESYFISDYNGALYDFFIWYDNINDKFAVNFAGTTSVGIKSTAITSNADLWKWWFIGVTWDIPNDALKLYCYSADYPDGDIATSSSDLGTVVFEPYLNVGGIPLYTSPAGFEADSLMAGLFVDDTVWTEASLKSYYDTKRVFYDPNVISNFNRGVSIDLNGIQIKRGSVNITDQYGREIDISNQSGLLVKDASGQIVHDIPTAPVLANAYTMGHLYLFKNDNVAYTLWDNTAFSASTWTTATAVTAGNTNVKGIRIKLSAYGFSATAVTTSFVYIFLRPKGSNFNFSANNMVVADSSILTFNSAIVTSVKRETVLDVAVDSNLQFEFYIALALTSTKILYIQQLGVWV